MNKCRIEHEHGGIERQKQGISSITKFDSDLIFKELNIKNNDYFLDIGCGSGDYSFKAASFIGESGNVCALERWEELVEKLNNKIKSENIKNMQAFYADISKQIPVMDNSIDICFLAMVLHGFDLENCSELLFNEIHRIVKPNGRLAIIEMKKETESATHPEQIRLSPLDIENLVAKHSFIQNKYTDLGDAYMVQFGIKK